MAGIATTMYFESVCFHNLSSIWLTRCTGESSSTGARQDDLERNHLSVCSMHWQWHGKQSKNTLALVSIWLTRMPMSSQLHAETENEKSVAVNIPISRVIVSFQRRRKTSINTRWNSSRWTSIIHSMSPVDCWEKRTSINTYNHGEIWQYWDQVPRVSPRRQLDERRDFEREILATNMPEYLFKLKNSLEMRQVTDHSSVGFRAASVELKDQCSVWYLIAVHRRVD